MGFILDGLPGSPPSELPTFTERRSTPSTPKEFSCSQTDSVLIDSRMDRRLFVYRLVLADQV